MKRSNVLLSAFLVPALVLQGGTCAGGPANAPVIPVSLAGIETVNEDQSYSLAVSSVNPTSGTVFSAGTKYDVWCTMPFGIIPGGGLNPLGQVIPPAGPNGGLATYTPYNYSEYSVSTAGGGFGATGSLYDTATGKFDITGLSLAQEWNAVNWILNNPNGSSGEQPSATDRQDAIWQILHSGDAKPQVVWLLSPASRQLYDDALKNTSFDPTAGQFVAVLLVPTTPAGVSGTYQSLIAAVPLACSATGSAKLVKTVSVSSANAFQTVTYSYDVINTGTTALQDIVIVDDNGTPGYTEDDVTLQVPVILEPGKSWTVRSTVYLPITLAYTDGNETIFDTLIPQIPASPANSLLLTYLLDTDVTDNTYGTGAAADWANAGGNTFQQEQGNHAEFALYDSGGHLVSEFQSNYISNVGVSSAFPSGYGSSAPAVFKGGLNNISYITSTLADNLNGYSKFYSDTVNSPVGDNNWQTISGYKVIVNQAIFGWLGMGRAAIKSNELDHTKIAFPNGKGGWWWCGGGGSTNSITYTPNVIGSEITSHATLCARVCGCSTIVHACAKACVWLNGGNPPGCGPSPHRCQQPPACHCDCAGCKSGHCDQCTHFGCNDSGCQKGSSGNCPHGQVRCNTGGQISYLRW